MRLHTTILLLLALGACEFNWQPRCTTGCDAGDGKQNELGSEREPRIQITNIEDN